MRTATRSSEREKPEFAATTNLSLHSGLNYARIPPPDPRCTRSAAVTSTDDVVDPAAGHDDPQGRVTRQPRKAAPAHEASVAQSTLGSRTLASSEYWRSVGSIRHTLCSGHARLPPELVRW